MVQRHSFQSAGRIAFSTHCDIYIWGGVIPDVLMRRRRNLKFQGVTRHAAHATRHAAVGTAILLFLLLTSTAALAAVPSAPVITGPLGIQNTTDVWLTWDAPPEGADSYNVAVYDYYSNTIALPSTNTGASPYHVTGLADNHGFYAYVQAHNADGWGDWGMLYLNVCSTLEAPSGQPAFITPIPLGATDPRNPLAVTFEWDRIARAGLYWLAVNEWHNTGWTTVFAVYLPDPGTGTTMSYPTDPNTPVILEEAHYYGAWLVSANPEGSGPYNDPFYFGVSTATAAPQAPTMAELATTYSDDIPLSSILFQWSSTPKTLGYYYVLYDESASVEVGTWWADDPGTGDPLSFTLPSNITLVEGDSYWFSVQGWNPWGSGTGTIIHFIPGLPPDPNTGPVWTTPTTTPQGTSPTGVSPNNVVQPAFSWTSVAHATDYWVFVNEYQPETNSWPTVLCVSRAALEGSTQSWTVPSDDALSPGRRYGAYIRWYSRLGNSDWSGMLDFTVAAPLTITADAKSKFYGADNPELTFTCSGLVNGDTADEAHTGALSTTASTGSAVGNYPISEGTLAATGYYYIATFNCGTLTVTKATPVISWSNPADIFYGTVLSSTQLNATANVPGTFMYQPGTGTWLSAGANQTLSVTFTPTDTANYTTASATAHINVIADPTPPVITSLFPTDGFVTTWPPGISADITDSGSGVDWSSLYVTLDGMALGASKYEDEGWFCCAYPYQLPGGQYMWLSDGQYTVAVSVRDHSYDYAYAYSTFTLDRIPPTVTATICPAPIAGWNNSHVTVTFHATDTCSGVASVTATSISGSVSGTDHVDIPVTTEGYNHITATATDNAGNTAATSVTVFINRVEILTPLRDTSGNLTSTLVPTDVVSASYSRPIPYITSPQSTNAVTIANGQVSFTLAGYVSDAFADIVPSGAADVGSVAATVSSAPSLQQTITVTRDGNQTATLLRPYAFQGDFSDVVSFPALKGLHVLTLQTGPNIIGRTGYTTLNIRLVTGEDLEGNEFLTASEVAVGNSNLQDFFQPFLVRVQGDKTLLEGNKCYLYDNEFTLRGQPDNSVFFADQQNKPVVAAYLPSNASISGPNLSAIKLIEASLDPVLGYGKKTGIPITAGRFIVPTSSQNAVRIHRPEVFNTLGLKIKNGSGALVRQFANILPGDFLWDGKDSNGNILTEAQAPLTLEFDPSYSANTGCLTPEFSISGIRLEENHWAFRIPGQPSLPNYYAAGIDPASISLDSLEIKLTPDGG